MKTWFNYKLKHLFLILSLFPVILLAQQGGTGNWLMYFGTNKISDKYSIHSEVQYRNHTAVPNNIEQLLLRTGLNYHISDKAIATFGYAYVPSYVFESEQKAPETTEHRIWQQFILTNKLSKLKFEHRYRLEQRWVSGDYRNRFRYRLMLTLPISEPDENGANWFLGAYNEIFINSKDVFFDRNRLYGAIGYQFGPNLSAQNWYAVPESEFFW